MSPLRRQLSSVVILTLILSPFFSVQVTSEILLSESTQSRESVGQASGGQQALGYDGGCPVGFPETIPLLSPFR